MGQIFSNTIPALSEKHNGFATEHNILIPFIFRYSVVEVVDSVKARLTDPCITCHWSSVGFDTTTLATFHITSPEVGHLARLVCYYKSLVVIISLGRIKIWGTGMAQW